MGSKSGTPTSAGVMVVSPTSLTARPPGQPGIGRCRRDQPAGDPASLAADHYACDAPAVTAVIVAFGASRVPTVTVYAIELSLEVPGLAGLADRSTSQSLLALACRPPPRGTRSRRSAARHRRAAGWRRWLAPLAGGHEAIVARKGFVPGDHGPLRRADVDLGRRAPMAGLVSTP